VNSDPFNHQREQASRPTRPDQRGAKQPSHPAAQRLMDREKALAPGRPTPSPRRPRPGPQPARYGRRGCAIIGVMLLLVVCLAGGLVYGLMLYRSPSNILVLGVDRRPGEGDVVRTDTMLLVRADPAERRLVLLSIPRDLWVEIPGHGQGRINTAHVYGELEEAGSGPSRAEETVTHNLGVPVQRYLRMDFDGFRDVVAAAGGVDVSVPAPVIDNAYPTEDYGTIHIEIPAGFQHMDAETALQYARSRHSSSDFDRAARQQQIMIALVKKLARPSGWPAIPRVYRAFQKAVESDMTLRDMVVLFMAWERAGDEGMERIVIDQDMTTPYQTPEGASVLLPRWEMIQPAIQAAFAR
jgi:LCP family protein required for cell wall assembly